MMKAYKPAVTIAVLYSLFAVVSMLVNISTQMLFIALYTKPNAVEFSILVGTVTGLPLRYLLEKRYIFAFRSQDIAEDVELFVLYSFMSVLTTALFWGTEYTFHILFQSDATRYIGGAIGLAMGFYVKYQLDKKCVFVKRSSLERRLLHDKEC